MKNPFISTVLFFTALSASLVATEVDFMAVNTEKCFTKSKFGKQGQEDFEAFQNQKNNLLKEISQKIQEIAKNLNDEAFLDSLNPEAEQKLRVTHEQLNVELEHLYRDSRQAFEEKYAQFNQKMLNNIHEALNEIKKEKNIKCSVLKGEAFYSYPPESDITDTVIKKLDERFDQIAQTQKKTPSEPKHEVVK